MNKRQPAKGGPPEKTTSVTTWKEAKKTLAYQRASESVPIAKLQAMISAYSLATGQSIHRGHHHSDRLFRWWIKSRWLRENTYPSILFVLARTHGINPDRAIAAKPGSPKWREIVVQAARADDYDFLKKLFQADDLHKTGKPICASIIDYLLIDYWLEIPIGQPGLCCCNDAVIADLITLLCIGKADIVFEAKSVNRRIKALKLVRICKSGKRIKYNGKRVTVS